MNALVPHIFEDQMVRSVMRDDAVWFVGRDVCHVLSIKNESDALARLDDDERSEVAIADPSGTKWAIIVSEPGVFRLIFTSRKPAAERFKRWLAHDVLPEIRRTGQYRPAANPLDINAEAATTLSLKLNMVREARQLFGASKARDLWGAIGLPELAMPGKGRGPSGQGPACLAHMLDAETTVEGRSVRGLLEQAFGGDDAAVEALRGMGIAPCRDGGSFVVSNRHYGLTAVFARTPWIGNQWAYALREVPGAIPNVMLRIGDHVSRAVLLPESCLALPPVH